MCIGDVTVLGTGLAENIPCVVGVGCSIVVVFPNPHLTRNVKHRELDTMVKVRSDFTLKGYLTV